MRIPKFFLYLFFLIGIVFFLYTLWYTFQIFQANDLLLPKKIVGCLSPNEEGDMIGGIINPMIGFSICIFSALAFYAQYDANRQIQNEFRFNSANEVFNKLLDAKNENLRNYRSSNMNGLEGLEFDIKLEIKSILNAEFEYLLENSFRENPEYFINEYYSENIFYIKDILKLKSEEERSLKYNESLKSADRLKKIIFYESKNQEFIEKKRAIYRKYIEVFIQKKINFLFKYKLIYSKIIFSIKKEFKDLQYESLINDISLEEFSLLSYLLLGYEKDIKTNDLYNTFNKNSAIMNCNCDMFFLNPECHYIIEEVRNVSFIYNEFSICGFVGKWQKF